MTDIPNSRRSPMEHESCLPDDLPAKLRQRLTMSMFASHASLWREQEAQRDEAADRITALEAERDAAYRRGLEDAVKVAEGVSGWTGQPHCSNMDYGPNTSQRIAAAIRALAQGEQP